MELIPIKNKKAQEKYLSIWNIIVWVLIAVVIIAGISFYNSSETDIRKEEAKTLNQKILNCLVEYDGTLKKSINESLDIFRECSLSKKLFESDLSFFTKIELFQVNKQISETPRVSLSFGNKEFDIQCALKDKKFAKCYSGKVFVRNAQTNEDFLLKVKTGSNNKEEKIR